MALRKNYSRSDEMQPNSVSQNL